MKKTFEKPVVKCHSLQRESVIATSGEGPASTPTVTFGEGGTNYMESKSRIINFD